MYFKKLKDAGLIRDNAIKEKISSNNPSRKFEIKMLKSVWKIR